MRGTFQQVSHIIETRTSLKVYGASYPVSNRRSVLSKALFYMQILALIVIFFSQTVFSYLGFGPGQTFFASEAFIDHVAATLLLLLPFVFLRKRSFRLWLLGYAVSVATFLFLGFKFSIPVGLMTRSLYSGPTESDFLRAIIGFGAAGILSYSLILSFIGAQLFSLLAVVFKTPLWSPRFLCGGLLCLMTLQFLSYQLIAPYVISGYVIFASFLVIWFPLTEMYLNPWNSSECL